MKVITKASQILDMVPADFSLAKVGLDPLPRWVQADDRWYKQLEVVSRIWDALQDVKVVWLQAPTGTGKTLIAELVGRLQRTNMVYTCTTKALQDQFGGDFPDAAVIKGKANYLTESGMLDAWGNPITSGYSAITCADCTKSAMDPECRWCNDGCPYMEARETASESRLAVANMSYYLTDTNKGRRSLQGRGFVVVDECDMLEGELLNQFEVVIGPKRQANLGLYPPTKKTVSGNWIAWVENEAVPAVMRYLKYLPPLNQPGLKVDEIRERKRVEELLQKLLMLSDELGQGDWVYDGYTEGKVGKPGDNIIFRPVRVRKWGEEMLWPHADKWLMMSATILSADVMAEELGYNGEWELVDVGSDFPIKHRPIFVVPVADMSFKNRELGWRQMVEGVEGVCRLHPKDRVLVHCVSYDLAKYLVENVQLGKRNVVSYRSSDEKVTALRKYKNVAGSVMFAPSMDRGIDLPGDLCRVQILVKVPFPNIKDKRVSARMYSQGGQNWYRVQAVRTLIQMCGRGVRSKDDWAWTYILDSQFVDNLWKSGHYLFPKWWKEAVKWDLDKGRLLHGR